MKSSEKSFDMSKDFEQLYNTYFMQVFSFIMTLSKNRDISEEITQKTFFKAMMAKKNYLGKSSELTWLCAIAKNLFIDEMRLQNKFSDNEIKIDNISEKNVENDVVNEDTTFRLHMILHNLDEPYKEVFQLRIFGEMSFLKIGKLFEKTENWARVTYHRAKLKIQERMDYYE